MPTLTSMLGSNGLASEAEITDLQTQINNIDTTYYSGTGLTLSGRTFSLTDEAYTSAEKTKLAGIESGATADQTASEIKTAYESNTNTNAYTDFEQTKLAGIESGATGDQTSTEIKTAYEANADTNAFTDAEKTKLASVALPVPPTLNTPTSGTEGDTLTITITNYVSTYVYYVGVQAGEVSRTGNTISWTLPYVDANTDYDLIVHAVNPANQMYAVTVDTVTVGDIPVIADDAVIITSFGTSSYNDGWTV